MYATHPRCLQHAATLCNTHQHNATVGSHHDVSHSRCLKHTASHMCSRRQCVCIPPMYASFLICVLLPLHPVACTHTHTLLTPNVCANVIDVCTPDVCAYLICVLYISYVCQCPCSLCHTHTHTHCVNMRAYDRICVFMSYVCS